MPRYIDADLAINDLCGSQCGCTINECGLEEPCEKARCILKQPTADVQEVRHGHWINDNCGDFVCSVCGWEFSDELPYMARNRDAKTEDIMRYCLHCGAELELKWGDEE